MFHYLRDSAMVKMQNGGLWSCKVNKRLALTALTFLFSVASAYAQAAEFFGLAKSGNPPDVQAAINKGADIKAQTSIRTLSIIPPELISFPGDVHQVIVTNSQGAVLSGVTFVSSNPAVANINSAGALTALTQGTAQITATIAAESAILPVTVTAMPKTIADVYTHFPFAYLSGSVALYSDISPAFSQQNGAGLTLVWNYFSKLFSKSYGGHAVVYYTNDQNLYALAYGFCNPNGTPPETQNTSYATACNDSASGIQALVMMPTFSPDTERLQDEIGHQFLYATYPQSFAYSWVYEGLGLYWEAGTFDRSGNLMVQSPGTYLAVYKTAKAQGSTVSLDTLVHMSEATFYSGLYSHSHQLTTSQIYFAQADIFMCYLFKKFPKVMSGLIDQWNRGTIKTNDTTITYITTQTGMTLAQLDAACNAFARSL
jgi:hypothetical protein